MADDKFAQIAAGYEAAKDRGLEEVVPPARKGQAVVLRTGKRDAFEPYVKMHTKEQLAEELARQREYYAGFLRDLAPPAEDISQKIEIRAFDFSLNDAPKSRVTIPHYSGPTGRQTAVYETEFILPEFAGKRVFLCFGGVDYTAEVYINGHYVGSHEGFFAPFEFDITEAAAKGQNSLRVIVRNDFVMGGTKSPQGETTGDKIYAATGPGWDDPELGWHHCPPGFGIYNRVYAEIREPEYISDVFPRVNSKASEVWIECFGSTVAEKDVAFSLSLYGQNFSETVFEDVVIYPTTNIEAGVGDTLTISQLLAEGKLGKGTPLKLAIGYNRFILPIAIPQPKIWRPETPFLYQIQVKLLVDGQVKSVKTRQFGVRDFAQQLDSIPKGKFLLNGEEIRLRGANTMGFEQQDVMRGDFVQLIDDILLAKICNMNFLRITQRPVQTEIYDYCDRLGLMVQTDLPLFGTIRINQYFEAVRQAGEMEHLVRSHPCCIIDSYINEPFPNAKNMPNRMLSREEMMAFFQAADTAVHLENPDRVTKHVDGDYDPPNALMPDNHCYTMWYNGHGMDMGKLHKGYWLEIKPGWYFGCGEFGAEGLDFPEVMRECYPKAWLAEPFHPRNIIGAQTGAFHYFFYEEPKDMEGWVRESHRHQAFATKIMTSAMRRQAYMNTFAIHLFIDAFPSGWMKTIMDCRRNPKPAYFTYRDCLSPVFCNIRSDRFSFYAGEKVRLEAYLCQDKPTAEEIMYMVKADGEIICSGRQSVQQDVFQGFIEFTAPAALQGRRKITVYMGAFGGRKLLHYAQETYTVFPEEAVYVPRVLEYAEYDAHREAFDQQITGGKTVVFAPLTQGTYEIAGKRVIVTDCRMHPLYVVSRDTGHPIVADFQANDFAYWYDSQKDRLAPILHATFTAEGVAPILTSGNKDDDGEWRKALACGEWAVGEGKVILCQLDLLHKEKNPAANRFVGKIIRN